MFASKDVFLTPPSTGGYTIGKSVRLRSSASAYLNRTASTPTNNQKFTWSAWVKLGKIASGDLFAAGTGASNYTDFYITSGNSLSYIDYATGVRAQLITTQVFRDPSAWYHIVLVVDVTNATAANRTIMYVNGIQVTSFSTNTTYTSSVNPYINQSTIVQGLGALTVSPSYFDGYLTEINFIDGQALTPSSFGTTNATTGVWQPAKYTGTYGTNGFYLNFSSNGTSAALGTDFSGNSNTWTVNNVSVTAGVTYDSMVDSPTVSAVSSNYAVINPLSTIAFPLSNGNLSIGASVTANRCSKSSIAVSSGKWYWEFKASAMSASGQIAGVCSSDALFSGGVVSSGYEIGYYSNNGNKYVNGTATAYGTSWTTTDTIGIALDVDGGTVTFYKNNVSQGAISITVGQTWVADWTGQNTTDAVDFTFGQRPFTYTPPTGFVALNTYNLPAGTITTSGTFTGNASTDGPFVYLNGVPTAMTINGNAVTFGTNADHLANGFKVRSSSASYNASGSNTYSITTTGAKFKNAIAQTNP